MPEDHFAESEPAAAAQRLRAFEDKHLGADTPRHGGLVERGSGAPLRNLPPELQNHHAALEHLVDCEKKVDDAAAALAEAQVRHETAKGHAANAAAAIREYPTQES